ncbi:MAG TPA: AAA family ATPase [Polyangia bacterium]|nr:AAA family ATPase [Polyangia bacterium]
MHMDVPAPPAVFVGREAELVRIARALEELRLVVIYGVAGVGKTALALRAAHELSAQRGARLAYLACRPGESATTAATALAAQLGVGSGAEGTVRLDPLRALMETAAAAPVVACIDDLQRSDPGLPDALAHLASRGLPLWIFATARERLALSPVAGDHLLVLLRGLDPAEAAALWSRLEQIYGPRPGQRAPTASAHTPLSIKQAFMGPGAAAPADPLGLEALPPAEARLLAQLCAFRRPVPTAAVATDPEMQGVLEQLEARFLVEPAPGGAWAVHDLVREAVARSRSGPGRAEHARCRAFFGTQAGSDEVRLEILHHAVAAGENACALDLLVAEAGRVARVPPGSSVFERDLGDAIDQLAARIELPAPVRALRASIRSRQGEPARACDELAALVDEYPQARLDYGAIAAALGRTRQARAALAGALADETLGPLVRLLAMATLCGAYRNDGDLKGAWQVLAGTRRLVDSTGALGQGVAAFIEALLTYDGGRYGAAADATEHARAALERAGVPFALPLLTSVERAVAAARGQPSPADHAGEPDELFDEAPFLRHSARLFRAEELVRRGQARAATALAGEVAEAASALGYPALSRGAARVMATAAEALSGHRGRPANLQPRRAGARAEGFDAASERLTRAEYSVAVGHLAAAERDAIAVEAVATPARWRHLYARAQLVRAEAALRRGRFDEARPLIAAVRAEAAPQGYAPLATACDILDAALARASGACAPVRDGVLAARLGLGAEPTLLVRDATGVRGLLAPTQLGEWDLSRYATTIDLVRRRVRLRRRIIDLTRRGSLIDLMRALAREPGALVSTAEVVRAVWNLEYHPLRHHSRITMAVLRLRHLLGPGIIEAQPEGYRLAVPAPWIVVEPR